MLYTVIFILIALSVITVCTLRGLKRGIIKPAVRAVFLIVCIPVSVLVSKLFSSVITPPVINSVLSKFSGFAAVASIRDNAVATSAAGMLTGFIVSAVVFALFYILFALLSKLLDPLIVKLFKKHTEIPKRSAAGAVIGGVCGLIITVAVFSPLAGLSAEAERFALSLPDSALKTQLCSLSGNAAFKATRVLGGNLIYHFTTSGKFDNRSVALSKETDAASKAFGAVMALTADPAAWGEEQTGKLNTAAESFSESYLIPSVASSVLSDAAAKWTAGEEFAGIKKPELNPVIQPTLNLIISDFSSCTNETLALNIKTLAGAFEIIIDNNAASIFAKGESDKLISTVLTKFSEGDMTEKLLMCFYDDSRLRIVIPEIYNIGIRALGEKLDIPADKEELHSRFIQKIVDAINANPDKAPDVRAVLLTDELYSLFCSHGMNCTPVSTMYISFYLINDFSGVETVNAADVESWFTQYSQAVVNAHKDDGKIIFTAADTSYTFTFLGNKSDSHLTYLSSSGQTDMTWATELEKSSVNGSYTALYKKAEHTYAVYTYTDGTLILISDSDTVLRDKDAYSALTGAGISLSISKQSMTEAGIASDVTTVIKPTAYSSLNTEKRKEFMKIYSLASSSSVESPAVPLPASIAINSETKIPDCISVSAQSGDPEDGNSPQQITTFGESSVEQIIKSSRQIQGSGSGSVAGCQSADTMVTNQKTVQDITVDSAEVAKNLTAEQVKTISEGITQMATSIEPVLSGEGQANMVALISGDTLQSVAAVANTLEQAQNAEATDNPDSAVLNNFVTAVVTSPTAGEVLNMSGEQINDTISAIQSNGESVTPGSTQNPGQTTEPENEPAFSEQYMAAIGSMANLFDKVMDENATEAEKHAAVREMLDNLTPKSASVISSYLSDPAFLISLKIPATTAPGLSVMLSNLFKQLSIAQEKQMSEEAYNNEADAIRVLLEVVLSARAGNNAGTDAPKPVNMFGTDGKLKTSAEQLLRNVMKSKIVTYTAMLSFTSYPNAASFSTVSKFNPFNLKCFTEADMAEFVAACGKLASEQSSLAVASTSKDLWTQAKTTFTRQDYYRRLMATAALLGINYVPTQDITVVDITDVTYTIDASDGIYVLSSYVSGKIILARADGSEPVLGETAVNAKLAAIGYSDFIRVSGRDIFLTGNPPKEIIKKTA